MRSTSPVLCTWIVAASTVITGSLVPVPAALRTPRDGGPEVLALSRQNDAEQSATVSIAGAPTKGARSAKVAVIEYADFECPYCGAFVRETLPTLEREYIRTGKVLLVFKHRPIPSLHPSAVRAASAAECAGEQGGFWPMHDLLFSDQKNLSTEGLLARVKRLGLDSTTFGDCLELGHGEKRVTSDMTAATALRITGTPTFLIGTVDRGTAVVQVREYLEGAQPMSVFRPTLERLIAQAK